MEEPFRSIRFGRLFLFQGLNFPLDMDGRNRVYGTCGEALRIFFSVQPGQFHRGQKVPSWLFRKAPGRREGAVAPCRRPVLQPSRFSYHTSIWTSVRTCDTPGNPCSMVPQGAGGLRHIFEHGWPRSQPDPLLLPRQAGVILVEQGQAFFHVCLLGCRGRHDDGVERSGLGRFQHLYHEGRRQ